MVILMNKEREKVLKCYFRNHPKTIPNDVILIAGHIGSIVIGSYESIKPIIDKMNDSDYYLEELKVWKTKN